MPYLPTAQLWLTQSSLLLSARPATTRITTKYTIAPKPKSKSSKPKPISATETEAPALSVPAAPTAELTLKTFDPVSGTTLKYKTNKAAEVSRLIQILGRLARGMGNGGKGIDVGEERVTVGIKMEGVVEGVVETVKEGLEKVVGGVGGGKGKKKGKK
ncbi:signal recognition particle 9 kDa protein-domain-containing protein [Calycina marina]|uniref:Signal recognition particle 9 kDa protein-domain-containing protein n=1 Tax=Calycina marina TaxID=1763456 RepID=A0A9P7Z1H1_9HELO|nr:signal recognition particle 9 kDa protein-domain-containing protein [Calycina marina]